MSMSARLLKCALYMGAGEVVVQKVGAVVGEAGHPTGDGKCDDCLLYTSDAADE